LKTKNRGKSPSKVGEDAETRLFEGAIVLAEQIINRNAICSAFPKLSTTNLAIHVGQIDARVASAIDFGVAPSDTMSHESFQDTGI
jgi:hypothetical protein